MKKNLVLIILGIVVLVGLIAYFCIQENRACIIKIASVQAKPGELVEVPVEIEKNPGVLGAMITIEYDDGVSLIKAENGEAFQMLTMTKAGTPASPCNFLWDGEYIDESQIKNGTILKLTFIVNDEAQTGDEYNLKLSYKKGNIVDQDLNSITAKTENGVIKVN